MGTKCNRQRQSAARMMAAKFQLVGRAQPLLDYSHRHKEIRLNRAEERNRSNALEAYLLGCVGFESLLALQRRLVYEVGGERSRGVLILCEVPPLITVGRAGSRAHILFEPHELWARAWPTHWINRGGGCLLHLPGQLQIINVMALDHHKVDVATYLDRMHEVLRDICRECDAAAMRRPDRPGIWVGERQLAHIGVAVQDWVAYYGASLNIDPDLDHFRGVRCDGAPLPMTSLARERKGPVRPALIRQRLVETFAQRFGFDRMTIFHRHPMLTPVPASREFAYRTS